MSSAITKRRSARPRGPAVESLHFEERLRHGGGHHRLRRHRRLAESPGPRRPDRRRGARHSTTRWLRKPNPYFGAIVGRYGNRIAKAVHARRQEYKLAVNDGAEFAAWRHRRLQQGGVGRRAKCRRDRSGVELTYVSKDGEEGYPGNLTVKGDLHADGGERAADRLLGDHGQGHRREPDQPLYFNLAGRARATSWATC